MTRSFDSISVAPSRKATTKCKCSDSKTKAGMFVKQQQNSDFCAPLTAFDWNGVDPKLLGKYVLFGFHTLTLPTKGIVCSNN
ncbi:unnamed protein product [Clavelina lepadiformis]|uniref:Uncharacterized protein n=1 Tax=Clavelina lepadiformis TaxID=159417 RepID=A0ABP0F0B1_CLALP